MTLKIYNTKTREKEIFTPLDPSRIKMYVCGPTVYNLIHIGNARPFVIFDTLFRLLQTLYDDVVYARNITDIDDKIMKAAVDNNKTIDAVAERFTGEFYRDMEQLNVLEPTVSPRATEHLRQMIQMIEKLIERGHAYLAEGHVLFDVKSMTDYGKLSNRSLDDMLEGARVEVADYKKYAGDFVLWKPSQSSEPGWDSPWGRGRPGWHLECSAMIETHLGDTIDIHGGGRDLIFPHHENEVAQSECAHGGKHFVRYWMHNGYINIDGEKMSKSLGNFRTVRDILKRYRGEVVRFALLSAQYRSEMDFSQEILDEAQASLDSLYGTLRKIESVEAEPAQLRESAAYNALLDDLNTPLAISELHQLARQINKGDEQDLPRAKGILLGIGGLMGILQQAPEAWFQQAANESAIPAEDINQLIEERQQAKKDKNYARADEIRQQLKEAGVVLEDSREGTTWRRES